MTVRRSKIASLRELLAQREQQTLRALADRNHAMDAGHARQRELSGMQQEYRSRLRCACAAGITADELRLWRRFTESLDQAVAVQSCQLDMLKRELAEAKARCLMARSRRLAGEKLETLRDQRTRHRERRRERTEAADRANRRNRN